MKKGLNWRQRAVATHSWCVVCTVLLEKSPSIASLTVTSTLSRPGAICSPLSSLSSTLSDSLSLGSLAGLTATGGMVCSSADGQGFLVGRLRNRGDGISDDLRSDMVPCVQKVQSCCAHVFYNNYNNWEWFTCESERRNTGPGHVVAKIR